jgi:hypothetical protein
MVFYELCSSGNLYADPAEGTDWEGIKYPVYEGHRRAGKRIGDLRVDLPSSKVTHFTTTLLSDWWTSDGQSDRESE